MAQNKNATGLHPRPEAGALPKLDQLTGAQKTAARQVLGLLRGLSAHISTSEEEDDTPIRIDRLRHNGIILIDGARGSGKTMLLVSLLAALRQIAFPKGRKRASAEDAQPKAAEETIGDLVKTELDGRTLVVPLALIDLAPLPTPTNLLLHLVSCMEPMVDYLNARSHTPGSRFAGPAWLADGGEQSPVRKAWCDLARVIVGGWDQKPDRRQAPSEMDSYAEELMVAEQDRQARRIADRIDKFLNIAAEQYHATHFEPSIKRDILFLIAIDDADMNPKRSAELLDALRQLRSQRLTFLLTGDRVLFEHTLRHHCLSQIAGSLQQHDVDTNRADLFAVWSRTSALALQMYDKLIPPNHHCTLPEIPPAQRLTHEFEIAEASGELKPFSIKQRLDEIEVGESKLKFAQIFEAHGQLTEALPGHLRPLINAALLVERILWQSKLSRDTNSKHQPATDFVEHLWQSALRDAGEQLDGIIGRCVTREQSLLSVDIGSLALTPELEQDETRSNLTTLVETRGKRLQSRLLFGGLNRLNGVMSRERPLPRPVISSLQLAAVVAAEQAQATIRSHPSNLTGFEPVLVAADVRHGEDLQLQVAWPLPEGCSFVDLAVLNWNWRLLTSQITAPPKNAEDPAEAYVRVYLDVINCYFTRLSTGAAMSPLMPELPLTDLIERTARSARTTMQLRMRQVGYFQKWALHRMGLLAAPESGLSPQLANRILAALRAEFSIDEWRSVRVGLARARTQRLNYSLMDSTYQGKLKEQLLAIEKTAEQHAWRVEMANWENLPEGEKEPAMEAGAAGIYGIEGYLVALLADLRVPISDVTANGLGSASAEWALRWEHVAGSGSRLVTKLHSIWRATMEPASYGSPEDPVGGYKDYRKEAEELVSLKDGKLDIQIAPWHSLRLVTHWSGLLNQSGPVSQLHLSIMDPDISPSGGLTQLQRATQHVLWDILQQRGLLTTEDPVVGSGGFDGAGIILRYENEGVLMPWPAPRWRTFFAIEQLFVQWNRELLRLIVPTAPLTSWQEQETFDCLAFYYVRLCAQGIRGTQLAPAFPLKPPDVDSWLQVIEEIALHPIDYRSGVTEVGRTRFIEDLLWLAAPESGLSATSASCLLRALVHRLPSPLPKEFLARRSKRIPELRRSQRNVSLDRIDQAMPNHPFPGFWENQRQ